MRVLVLCKRQYTNKDLLDDHYGRLFELPAALAREGHQLSAAVSSYRRRGEQVEEAAGVSWHAVDAWPRPWVCVQQHERLAARWRPDVIWASSDVLHLVAGVRLGHRLGVPVVLDWYDDYAAFGLSRVPGMQKLLRWACAHADGLTVVSQTLKDLLPTRGPVPALCKVIGNGVPDQFATTLGREAARTALRLPINARLVGTAGALESGRGIEDLFAAFRLLRERQPELRLVVAGPRAPALRAHFGEGVIDLGTLPYAQVPLLLRSLDVGVICNRDSAFGRACYPQKLGEMVSSELPLVAAAVGETALLLAGQPESLYPPGDAATLARRIETQLAAPRWAPTTLAASWAARGVQLGAFLRAMV